MEHRIGDKVIVTEPLAGKARLCGSTASDMHKWAAQQARAYGAVRAEWTEGRDFGLAKLTFADGTTKLVRE